MHYLATHITRNCNLKHLRYLYSTIHAVSKLISFASCWFRFLIKKKHSTIVQQRSKQKCQMDLHWSSSMNDYIPLYFLCSILYPDAACMEYLPTCTMIPWYMWVDIPHMEHMGYIYIINMILMCIINHVMMAYFSLSQMTNNSRKHLFQVQDVQ